MRKASDVMTREPACCEPGESITRVAALMKRENVGSVPVVDGHETRQLVGIVTDRDIVVNVLADSRDIQRATVRDAMTSNPASVRENDDIEKAVKLMADRQVRRMPVVDGSGKLVGIIAQADVATRVDKDQMTGQLVEAISEPGTKRV
jgi:CBS domain-containing protein